MKGVRGAAHFEMVISFVVFVGFVFFLFYLIPPYSSSSIPETLTESIYISFLETASTNLTKLFLKTDYDSSGCFSVEISEDILNYELTESIVYNPSLEKRKSSVSGNEISIEGNDQFFDVLISPIFSSDSLSGCEDREDFTLGSIVEEQILAYPKIINLSDRYETDYEALKGELAVLPNYDFAISSSGLGLAMSKEIPVEVEVLSKNYVEDVLYENGTIINVEFVVKVW